MNWRMNFGDLSQNWWDVNGPMRPLHKLNPQRVAYIKAQAAGSVNGKSILDIGCGGGIVCEPLARLGGKVTGIDVAPELIETAKHHAKIDNLDIIYKNTDLSDITETFDIVLALEVVEHVDDPAAFIELAAARVKNGGILILSTLNRTLKSLALGKYAAEYVLRWVPAGTHHWNMFIKPSELVGYAEQAGLKAGDLSGLRYNPLNDEFALDKNDLSINYFLTCRN